MTRPEPEVRVLADAQSLADAAALALLNRLASDQAAGGTPHVGLTGGSIARTFHRSVLAQSGDVDVDWSRVDVWWGDERFVAATDPERNALQAREDLVDAVALDPARIHEAPAAEAGLSVEDAAAAYAEELRTHGAGSFSVLLLGLGPDGHVASLFPEHPALEVDGVPAVAVRDSPKPPPLRISLTLEALNRADAVWFLVSGEDKAEALRAALTDGPVPQIPARGVRGTVETVVFTDEAAAGLLDR